MTLANGAPALQPASYLPVSSAPALKPAKELDKPRGGQAEEGTESSRPFTGGGSGAVSAAATSAAIGDDGSGGPAPGLIVLAALAGFVALFLVGLRRRAVVRQRGATMTPAVAAPAAAVAAAPVVEQPRNTAAPSGAEAPREAEPPRTQAEAPTTSFAAPPVQAPPQTEAGWSGPSADAPEAAALKPSEQAAQRDTSRVGRAATVVATSVVSFAVRELARRRRRR